MKHLDLFSGIGGFALATEMVWDEVEHVFCDNEPFSQAVLKKHWPNSKIYGDIRTLTADAEYERLQGRVKEKGSRYARQRSGVQQNQTQNPFILTGGFPCQPFSQAGRRRGTEDDRHLWPEMLRVIQEFHPRWVIGENVGGFVTWNEGMVLEQVHLDLEGEGYEVQSFIIPACAINAPHRRDRVWIVARNTDSDGRTGWNTKVDTAEGGKPTLDNFEGRHSKNCPETHRKDAECQRCRGRNNGNARRSKRQVQAKGCSAERNGWNQNWVEVAARLCLVDDGLSDGLARPKGWRNAALKGAGNAIVPQVAAEIMKAIKEIDI